MITMKQALKHIRSTAYHAGLTFKIQPNLKINGGNAYMFIDRKTKERVLYNCTFWSSYSNCESGYISSYNKDLKMFKGLSIDETY